MSFLEIYGKEIVALLVPFIAWALNNGLKRKAKLQVALPHQFTFLVQQPLIGENGQQISPNQTVKTNSFIIKNAGKESATKLELVFNWKPMCVNLWPLRHFDYKTEPDQRYIMFFDNLAPNETLGIEVLAVNADLPKLLTVRSAECTAEEIIMYPQPVVSSTTRLFVGLLLILGLATLTYITIALIQFLVLRTPIGY